MAYDLFKVRSWHVIKVGMMKNFKELNDKLLKHQELKHNQLYY